MVAEEPKDAGSAKVTILVALIGAAATILAALIALIPTFRSLPAQAKSADEPTPVEEIATREPTPFKPRMDDCVGRWRWRTTDRSINLDLNVDGSFTAEDFPDSTDSSSGFGVVSKGKGHWSVEDGRLTVTMTHVWAVALWKENEVTWIDAKKVTSVSRNEVTLQGAAPLRRR
jgi:hypothetical protein